MVPEAGECLLLLKRFDVPANVVEHSRMVCRVATRLATELNSCGERLDLAKVEAGALLHDIAKMSAMNTGRSHAQAGADLLRELGFPEVAEIVRQHVVLETAGDSENGEAQSITEPELVNYSDKRVKHTRVVSVAERFEDLRARYGKSDKALAMLAGMERSTWAIEKRVFRKISLAPESLNRFEWGRTAA